MDSRVRGQKLAALSLLANSPDRDSLRRWASLPAGLAYSGAKALPRALARLTAIAREQAVPVGLQVLPEHGFIQLEPQNLLQRAPASWRGSTLRLHQGSRRGRRHRRGAADMPGRDRARQQVGARP